MNEMIKRYDLAITDKKELKDILSRLDFKEGSWQAKYKDCDVMSKCIPLNGSIELHIVFDLEKLQSWDDYEDCLVLDDDYCQPYNPFYQDEIDFCYSYIQTVIKNYNRAMDSLVGVGLLKPKTRKLCIDGVVRDMVVHNLEMEGYTVKSKSIDSGDVIPMLAEKLSQEAMKFKETPEYYNLIDILELVDVIKSKMEPIDWKEVEKTMDKKRKVRGSYNNCMFIESVEVGK